MRARIHRGAHEIGGTCVEVEAAGGRIVLDLGRPLDAPGGARSPLPKISGLEVADRTLLGIIVSHPHQDHWGLLADVSTDVPVYIGEAAGRILKGASFFGTDAFAVRRAGVLRDRSPFALGPFRITPFLNDHSAFDAYSLLVEAEDRRLFYTGDFRGHGRKRALFEWLLRSPPRAIDVLLMEGTHVGAEGRHRAAGPSEHDVETSLINLMRSSPGPVLVAMSAQNIDRVVSVYRACRASKRVLVVDLYAATVATATGRSTIPQPGFPDYLVWVPQRQRVLVKKREEFHRVEEVKTCRVFPEQLAVLAPQAVFLLRVSLAAELERSIDLQDARLVWSQWSGYLEPPYDKLIRPFLDRHHLQPVVVHSSGHASIADLHRLVTAMKPRRLVPVHTFGGEGFPELFSDVARVDVQGDGTWWDVRT